jgi:predicted ribosomally synthesized peptide with SipW-like signal peptide
MKQRKLLIAIISVVLVALISIGATLAYLIATDAEDNEVTIGDVSIELLEYQRDENGNLVKFVDDKLLLPAVTYDYGQTATVSKKVDGNNIRATVWKSDNNPYAEDKMVFVKNTGTLTNAYVRLCFAFEAGNYASFEQFKKKIHVNINETNWDWTWDEKLAEVKGMKCFIAWATYNNAIAPGEITTFGMSQIALDGEATNADTYGFGDKYDVLVLAQGIQADGMGTADKALGKGFGTDVPFAGFRYVTFADLKTALHYLDANTNGTTFKGAWGRPNTLLNTVTFGLFEDYYEKVLGHDGAPTTNASGDGEFAGYTYYVPNGDKYDLYVLTDSGVIYMPKDCSSLFAYMQSLTKVSTGNMDVSRVTTMNSMFKGCSALEELDVTGWDVGKVTSVNGMFESCTSLTELAVGTWQNVNNITETTYAFKNCKGLTYLDISNWKFDKVGSTQEMFKDSSNLVEIKTSNFSFGSATMVSMFHGCSSLRSLDVSGWDVSKVYSMRNMFNGCSSLTELAVSQWNVQSLKDMNYLFSGCSSLSSDNFDVSGWNVSGVTNFSGMFNACSALTALDLSKWTTTTTNPIEMYEMFQKCSSLTELDLSNWDTSKVITCDRMFSGCSKITTIYVSDKWNMSSVNSSVNMFNNCSSLKGGSGTTYNSSHVDVTYAHIDGGETNPGYLTQGPAPATT